MHDTCNVYVGQHQTTASPPAPLASLPIATYAALGIRNSSNRPAVSDFWIYFCTSTRFPRRYVSMRHPHERTVTTSPAHESCGAIGAYLFASDCVGPRQARPSLCAVEVRAVVAGFARLTHRKHPLRERPFGALPNRCLGDVLRVVCAWGTRKKEGAQRGVICLVSRAPATLGR